MKSQTKSEKITTKGEKIYRKKIQKILEPDSNGLYVAIDVDTGDYLTALDRKELMEMAEKRFGDKIYYVRRIGHKAMVTFRNWFLRR